MQTPNDSDRTGTSAVNPESGRLPAHVVENRRYWDEMAHEWVSAGERSWKMTDPTWGIWGIPESEISMLPTDMSGLRAIELGCGTGYVSAWMTRRGASVVGIDNSANQLETARRLALEYDIEITFVHGNAEVVPYPDGSFDFAISEYGAAIWCDPRIWIPEAFRLLAPGGELRFLGTHPIAIVSTPDSGAAVEERLNHPYFGMHMTDWRNVEVDPGGIEFNLTISEWIRLFTDTGFCVNRYEELAPPATAAEDRFGFTVEWAKRWPSEQVWYLQKPRE